MCLRVRVRVRVRVCVSVCRTCLSSLCSARARVTQKSHTNHVQRRFAAISASAIFHARFLSATIFLSVYFPIFFFYSVDSLLCCGGGQSKHAAVKSQDWQNELLIEKRDADANFLSSPVSQSLVQSFLNCTPSLSLWSAQLSSASSSSLNAFSALCVKFVGKIISVNLSAF